MTMTPGASDAEQRGEVIKMLDTAMRLAEDLGDDTTAYLIERALDEARSRVFTTENN